MFKIILLLLLFGLNVVFLYVQVIYSELVFLIFEDEVMVFFNVLEGNGGLQNCGCDVYLYIGVIINFSLSFVDWCYVFIIWGQANDDWKMILVFGEDNFYSYIFLFLVNVYYGVFGSEMVE